MLHLAPWGNRIKWMLFVVLFCTCFQQVQAQYFTLDSGRQRSVIPFKFFRNLVIVQAMINNKGPFNFILDTGVGEMVITDPTVADSLKINPSRKIKISGFGQGEDIEASITPEITITLKGLTSHFVHAAILKKDIFELSNYAGIRIHGLLGYEFFNKLAVAIDFADTTVTAYSSGRFKGFSKGATLPITIESNRPYVQTTITRQDGSQTLEKLIVDLGAGHALTLENIQDKSSYSPKLITGNLGFGIKGVINGSLGRVKALDIGRYKLQDLIVSYPEDSFTKDLSVSRDGNLGVDALKRFKVVFDYEAGVMYFRPNQRLDEPFEHDMTGLEYYASGDDLNRVMIDRVEPGSPAENAGLEKDDEIISINFKPVSTMTMEQIDGMFKSRDGRMLIIDVMHDQRFTTILTLKRRI